MSETTIEKPRATKLSISLPSQQASWLARHAAADQRTVSSLIQKLVAEELTRRDEALISVQAEVQP